VYASSISYNGFTTVASTSTGAGSGGVIGTDGYEFLETDLNGTIANVSSTPTYVASINIIVIQPSNGTSYSNLEIGGTTYHTGILYKAPVVAGTSYPVATITLTTNTTFTIPSELQLGFLEDNGSTGNESDITVSDSQGGGTVSTVDTGNNSVKNDFYLVDISGATYGDVITVTGSMPTSSQTSVALGGITFDTIPTPEPMMLSLLAVGALGLLGRRRRTC
jgi:hypothetical protein